MPLAITLRVIFDMYTEFAVELHYRSEGEPLPELVDAETYLGFRNSLSNKALKRLREYAPLREIHANFTSRDARNVAIDAAIKHILDFDPLEGIEGDKRKHFRAALKVLLTSLQYQSIEEGREYLNATMCPRVCNSLEFYAYENLVKLPDYPRLAEDEKVLSIGQGVLWLAYEALCTTTE
jgi:hypothetical protein